MGSTQFYVITGQKAALNGVDAAPCNVPQADIVNLRTMVCNMMHFT